MFLPEVKEHPVRPLMKKYKIKLAPVAQFLGVGYHHASKILSGKIQPSSEVKPKLDRLLKHLLKKEGQR